MKLANVSGGAFATSRIVLPRKRVIINLAPADVPKADSGFDMAIAVAILAASDQIHIEVLSSVAFIGELGLRWQHPSGPRHQRSTFNRSARLAAARLANQN